MSHAITTRTEKVIGEILDLVAERLPEDRAGPAGRFIEAYYAGAAAEDLLGFEVVDLYGAAVAHWSLAKQRRPGVPKLRVYNPQPDQQGWQSTHTIVEIVTDDMPFLVDSVRMTLNERGLTTHLVVHPVMRMRRDADGRCEEVLHHDAAADGTITEAVMHIEVDRQTEADVLAEMHADLERVLGDVRRTVEDWREMRERLRGCVETLASSPPPLDASELDEGRAFLDWIGDDHFTFLGYREYDLSGAPGKESLRSVGGSGLGLLRDGSGGGESRSFASLTPQARKLARKPELLIITKANSRSTVHRPGYLDYIGVKKFDADGNVAGEHRFLGLFTSAAFNRVPRDIPLLRRKVEGVLERARYPSNSHAAKALLHILETFPRDLLFQVDEEELFDTTLGILHLQERQRIRLFVHADRFGRFHCCIVYVPRERFNTQIRLAIQSILEESFGGEGTEFTVQLSESVLARLYFVIRAGAKKAPKPDIAALEARLRDVTRAWTDDLYAALLDHCGEERGTRLYRRYGEAFRADYRDGYPARIAVFDVERMERLAEDEPLTMTLYRPLEAADDEIRFKLFHLHTPVSLSDALPMLENMGLRIEDERPSKIKRAGVPRVWMHDFGMRHAEGASFDIDAVKGKFQDAFARIWKGDVENDGFNRLVLRARLAWRDIVILRAYCKYLRQAGVTLSRDYMEHTLSSNPGIAALLVELFRRRFDPASGGDAPDAGEDVVARVHEALDAVANLDEDRILRSFLGVIRATLRTNFFQVDESGEPKSYVSFKFDPKRIAELPEPRPMFEIFVYSPRVEGVHLRGGPVARGGLRWSDRREDFRTEVLGLVKAQMVKNAVIVPVGSKGGFVPKRMPTGDREAIQAEGVACYRIFIRGLLDITDNIVQGAIAPPPEVVRHDGDDPYLVVAADKGTATFSDIANGIAREYGFWLDDAFASGGSQGYDHKGMGITARGAWESVKRHFRELGYDTQKQDFTVVGIGDMAGDVFGNGMLLSRHIRLVGAFNHMHLFLDPEPDAAASFEERKRLFELPRSSWEDYDQKLISEGGGIFRRSAKSIRLSPQVKALLGVDADALTPNEVIRALLKAPVDLLWNGGIGTYVKSSDESHGDVGDRANDAVRVDAHELRCRVVGEGGNLGLTQLGRIEFAFVGGRVNTDAIDNAGGVDCSDHEVNIKILLNEIVTAGDMTEKQRNKLLRDMTDDVASLVLRNNYLQTQALSLACSQAPSLLEVHARLMKHLEREGELARAIEFLPDAEAIAERTTAGIGLASPELSVLIAYVKIGTFKDLLASSLPDEAFVADELVDYFPPALRDKHRTRMPDHRLAREIVSTVVANELVNRAGITFAFRLAEETGADAADIARAYLAARDVFDMPALWREIEALDNRASAQAQLAMLLEGRKLVERSARWLLRNRPRPLDVGGCVGFFAPGAATLAGSIPELVSASSRDALEGIARGYVDAGVPEALAQRVAAFNDLYSALDIADVASSTDQSVESVAAIYFNLGERLDLHWLRDQINDLPRENRWQALSRAALRDELYEQEATLTADVLRLEPDEGDAAARIESWMQRNSIAVARSREILSDLKGTGRLDFPMISVAMREIRSLRQLETPEAAASKRKKSKSSKAA